MKFEVKKEGPFVRTKSPIIILPHNLKNVKGINTMHNAQFTMHNSQWTIPQSAELTAPFIQGSL